MKKIICTGLNSGLIQSNKYKGPSGKEYDFQRGVATEVKDKKDAEYFLKCGGKQKLFVSVGIIPETANKIKEVVTGETAPETKPAVYTEESLYAMVKAEQVKLIRELGGGNHRIPPLEKERVELILKFQNVNPKTKDAESKNDSEQTSENPEPPADNAPASDETSVTNETPTTNENATGAPDAESRPEGQE